MYTYNSAVFPPAVFLSLKTHGYKSTNTRGQVKAHNKRDSVNRYANRSDDFLFFITVDYLRAENFSFQTFCFLRKKEQIGAYGVVSVLVQVGNFKGFDERQKKK